MGILSILLFNACHGELELSREALESVPILELGTDFEIRANCVYFYEVALEKGQFLHAVGQQKYVDFVLRLVSPDGELVARVDSPNGDYGSESLLALVNQDGPHRLEVFARSGTTHCQSASSIGSGSLQLLVKRQSSESDRAGVAAASQLEELRSELKSVRTSAEPAVAVAQVTEGLAQLATTWSRLDFPRQEAHTLWYLAKAYLVAGNLESARAHFELAFAAYQEIDEISMQATCLSHIGTLQLELGQSEEALASFAEAAKLFYGLGLPQDAAWALIQVAAARQRKGDLEAALESLAIAKAVQEEAAESDFVKPQIDEMEAVLLIALQRFEKARVHLKQVEKTYRDGEERMALAKVLRRLAHIAYRQEEFEEAKAYIAESLEILDSLEGRPAPSDQAKAATLLLKGRIELAEGEVDAAAVTFETAKRVGDSHLQATALIEIGRTLRAKAEPEDALERYQEAQKIFERVGDVLGQAIASFRRAEVSREIGTMGDAWAQIQPALDLAEEHRQVSLDEETRIDYFAFRQVFYDTAIEILMDQEKDLPGEGFQEKALEVHENRRARSLVDIHRQSLERQEEDPSLNPLRPPSLPEASPGPLTLKRILGELESDNSLFLVYGMTAEASHLWTIDRGKVKHHRLEKRARIEGWARMFLRALSRPSQSAQEDRQRHGRELSEALLGPISKELAQRRLVIVPSGDLQAIPFSALPRPGAADDDFLIRHHEVIVLPSLNAWVSSRELEAERVVPSREILAFGDPVFDLSDAQAALTSKQEQSAIGREASLKQSADPVDSLSGRTFSSFDSEENVERPTPLPESRREVETIVSLVKDGGEEALLGLAANREAFWNSRIETFRIVHIATHAFQNRALPDLSGFILSLIDLQGNRRSGLVRAHEISQLKISAELVVLSACDTGQGTRVRGEGVLGLTRSFMEAGAPRVIASLWRVEDRATADLMISFYQKFLTQDRSPSSALRSAQLEMLGSEETSLPYYWASFVFHGDWRPPERTR